MTRYQTTTLAEIRDETGWSPIRLELGASAFGINAWTAREAGADVISAHDEVPSGHEELYLVTAGRAAFTVDGDEIDAPAGTIVFVTDPAVRRGAVAREPETTVVAVGGKAGESYRPRAWETNAKIFPLFNRGEHAEAKRLLLEALDRYEDRGALYYNLACAEAQLGETDAAFGHLRQGVKERPDLTDLARTDDDLAPLCDDPRFDEILGAAATAR
jgi:tetratricopeptide (TPR) repeat protein